MRHVRLGATAALLIATACDAPGAQQPSASPARSAPLPECEWCGAAEAPRDLGSTARLAPAGEPGERLVVTGRVRYADGRPAPNVLLYAYNTNAAGVYPKRGDETGNARRHGYLRGWLRTDSAGRYRIETIRPGTYPSRSDPAHIHMTVTPPGGDEAYIDDVQFDDDPLLTPTARARQRNRGGSGIVRAVRDASGALSATRDITLEVKP